MTADPYKTLQVDPEAEDEVIQAAYRRLAQKYHPDVAGPDGRERMAAINAAWELLRDPERRAAHDRERRRVDAPPPARRSAPPGTTPAAAGDAPSGRSAGGGERRQSESTSPDWSSGRSSFGGGYDADTMRTADETGAAGPPPGRPSGSVLRFGRFAGWSLGEIAGRDVDYLEWLDRMPIGRPYRDEIDALLRSAGRRRTADGDERDRRGLFRRR